MTTNLEKIFFNWILKNPQHIKHVYGEYFENEGIHFIYNCIRNEFMLSEDKIIPSKKEIFHLVELNDKKGEFEDGSFLKALMKIDFSEYRDEFVLPRFKAWLLYNASMTGLVNSYEDIKLVQDKTDINIVKKALTKIRKNIDESLNIQIDKGSLGLDFDDVDSHDQDLTHNKITSGFKCFDTITEGGLDRKTLNIWMGAPGSGKTSNIQNLAVNAVNAGYNVAYISLELSEKKCMKRIGSMRLSIPISEYTEKSKDKEYMKEKIREINVGNGILGEKPGKLFIKEYPSGTATISDIENYIKQVKEEGGINLDMVVVDYIQIMGTENGVDRNMLYLKGEHLAVGLRAIAQKYDLVMITATQIDKNKYGANSMELSDMSESKAIVDTADSVWGIILTPIMKMEGIYHWKWLKLRDNASDYERIAFKFNKNYLRLHSDSFIESTL